MSTNAKKTVKAGNRYIEMSWEEARKATEEFLAGLKKAMPIDPKDFVLKEKEMFRGWLDKRFGTSHMQDYLRGALKVDKSKTYCKKLIKELKEELSKNGGASQPKPATSVSQS